MKNSNRGFTLIELMVAISIIGVLSSITFSSLDSSRAKARDAVRASQTDEVIKALTQYSFDKGHFPGSDITSYTGSSNICLGLNDGGLCWPFGNPTSDPNGYAGRGSTALTNELSPYISKIPKDPLGTPDYGDYYLYSSYSPADGNGGYAPEQHHLQWSVETCNPDVNPSSIPSTDAGINSNGVIGITSNGTCHGGGISKLPLWYGYGCQYMCDVNLER